MPTTHVAPIKPYETVYIIDINYYIHAGHHGVRLTSRGKAIGGTFIAVKNLLKLASMSRLVIAALDSEHSFRKERVQTYKSNREHNPDITHQREAVVGFLATMGIGIAREYGYEADDIIATLSTHYHEQCRPCMMVTKDKDMCALVNETSWVFNVADGTHLDAKGVFKKWGVKPEKFEEYLSLVGDAADGFKGLPGVGPKAATEMLRMYGSVRNMLRHPENMIIKHRKKFESDIALDSLRESIALAALDRNVPNLEQFHNPKPVGIDKEAFNSLCDYHSFKSLKLS